jgi:hypothetical protein
VSVKAAPEDRPLKRQVGTPRHRTERGPKVRGLGHHVAERGLERHRGTGESAGTRPAVGARGSASSTPGQT